MAKKRKKPSRRSLLRTCLTAGAVFAVLAVGAMLAHFAETWLNKPVENAGEQLTAYSTTATTEQVFMNDQWYAKKDLDTMLVIGVDELGSSVDSRSYNNTSQADFLALYVHDPATDESAMIHLNRDTMTDITVLGVTGAAAGTQRGQLALSFNYGSGGSDSSTNTVNAVSHLLYGAEIDHYITVTMAAVPIINDWAGGVTLEIQDDFTGIDDSLRLGEETTLHGEQALTYVRTRRGLDDSTNLHRMKRQRQYAARWLDTARPLLEDDKAVAELVLSIADCHTTNCSPELLAHYAEMLASEDELDIRELEGEAVQGGMYMEYHVDEPALQQLVLDLFYAPVGEGV